MIVSLDIQPALAQRAGVGRYTRMLAAHLPAHAGGDAVRLFCFDFQRRGVPEGLPGGASLRTVRWVPGRLVQQAWKTAGWPPYEWFAGRAGVYHFPNFVRPPLRRGRSVVTLHDVSFLRFPEAAEPRNLRYLHARVPATVRRADAVITDSQAMARDIEELLGVPSERIFPIPLGLPADLRRPPPDEVGAFRRRVGLDRPYLLMVGTLEPRKNHAFLVEVFERLADFGGLLVLAGMRGWKVEPILDRIRRSPRAGRIRHLDYVADEDLPALYAGAELVVFPSLYEGFGFPPLEAMACGTPVVCSAGGALREVAGAAAEVIDTYDADRWAECVRGLLGDAGARARLVERGRAHAAGFTWDETARRTWDVYRAVAG